MDARPLTARLIHMGSSEIIVSSLEEVSAKLTHERRRLSIRVELRDDTLSHQPPGNWLSILVATSPYETDRWDKVHVMIFGLYRVSWNRD